MLLLNWCIIYRSKTSTRYIYCVDAPVEAHLYLTLGVSEASARTDADANLTYIVVEPTVPPLSDKITLEAKLPPDVVDTSNPLGAVTVISAVKPDPDTLKSCSLDALLTSTVALNDVSIYC